LCEDKKDIYIIILLADFDDDWRRNVANKIKKLYSDDVQEGTIQVLQSFSWTRRFVKENLMCCKDK
jgi:hypothetical protein